jgi:hypothetical protein
LCAGNCYLPDPSVAPWVGRFVNRCARFPAELGKPGTDDDIDAWTHMVNRARLDTHPLIEFWKQQYLQSPAAAKGRSPRVFGAEEFPVVDKITPP